MESKHHEHGHGHQHHDNGNVGGPCDDKTSQQNWVNIHTILPGSFSLYTSAFFGPVVPPPCNILCGAAPISGIAIAACTKYVLITFNALNKVDNSDIAVSLQNTPVPPAPLANQAFYSIGLFKGVLNIYNPDTISFSKATVGTKDTIVFQAIGNGIVLANFNLSDSVPMGGTE